MFKKTTIVISVLTILLFGFQKVKNDELYFFEALFRFPEKPVNLYNPVTEKGAELGRYLFYDTILSSDFSFSCASCHQQQFAFADNKKFSKGVDGEFLKRNTMPLFNLAWYSSFFWDGRATSIEDQIFVPVRAHNEMNLDWKEAEKRLNESFFYKKQFKNVFSINYIDSITISKAIAQFERTLISNHSKYDKVIAGKDKFTESEFRGFILVNDQSMADCLQCHTTDADALGTTRNFSNNGLDIELKDEGLFKTTQNLNDKGKFKIPSLRNIALTAPYMHDGRFETLEEVINFYSEGVQISKLIDSKMQYAHQGGVQLTNEEKKDVISFLKTLSDSTFISNTKFSNPFQ